MILYLILLRVVDFVTINGIEDTAFQYSFRRSH